MKRFLTAFLALSLCAGAVLADDISIYADQLAEQCVLTTLVPPPGTNNVYVVHKFNLGSTASQFKVTDTSGLFATTQTFPAGYLTIGTWNTDLSIAYGGCVIGDHVVATLSFLWFGAPFNCGNQLVTGPAPTTPIPGEIAIVDCAQPSGNLEPASSGQLFFGPNGDICNPTHCGVNAATESTWGAVKALYN
jgi:hypothetical protein